MNRIKKTILILCVVVFFYFLNAPVNFPAQTSVKIEKGMSLRSVSLLLKNENIIRSRIMFEASVILFGGEKKIMQANYYFENKLPVYTIARRIAKGEHFTAPIAVTIPEGFNLAEIIDTFIPKLPNFSREKFIAGAKEGYLFPDTYFFESEDDEQDVLKSMNNNFEKKIAPLREMIKSSGQTEKDIIIMASIIEREAKGDADRGLISGILWKRLSIGMALQADAAPETYKTNTLPKNPICNPGLLAIKSAIFPVKSNYLYYLHDEDGNIHYAKNFEEHKMNKAKYLK